MIIPIESLWWLDMILFESLFMIGILALGGIILITIDLSFKLVDIIKKHCNKNK